MNDFSQFRGATVEEALSGLGAGVRALLLDKDRQIAQLQAALREREASQRTAEERLRDEIARLCALLEGCGSAESIAADSETTAQSLHVIEEQARVIDEQQRRIRMLQRSARASASTVSATATAVTAATPARLESSAFHNGSVASASHVPGRRANALASNGAPPMTGLRSDATSATFGTPSVENLQARLNGIDRELADAHTAHTSDERIAALVAQQQSVRERLLQLRDEKLRAIRDFQQSQRRIQAATSAAAAVAAAGAAQAEPQHQQK